MEWFQWLLTSRVFLGRKFSLCKHNVVLSSSIVGIYLLFITTTKKTKIFVNSYDEYLFCFCVLVLLFAAFGSCSPPWSNSLPDFQIFYVHLMDQLITICFLFLIVGVDERTWKTQTI